MNKSLHPMPGVYSLMSFIGPTGQGVTDSYHVALKAVAKCNQIAQYFISNEYIAAELGRCIGIPIPPSGIVYSDGHQIKNWFACLNFNLSGNTLPPVNPDACVKSLPDLSTGLLLFDILIANSDRHRKNFSVDFAPTVPRMSVFDHSHALFGYQSGLGIQRLNALKLRLGISGGTHTKGNRHCLLDKIADDNFFSKWYRRIQCIPDYLIEDVCQATVELGMINKAEARAATSFLIYRRNNIRGIVKKYKHEFTAIKQWSLMIP